MAVTFGAFTVSKFIQKNKAFLPNVVTSGKKIGVTCKSVWIKQKSLLV